MVTLNIFQVRTQTGQVMVQQQQTAGGGQTVIRQQLAAGQQQLPSVAAGAAAAGGQRVVINQPGLRPGQPGSQITVPLSTLQVGHHGELVILHDDRIPDVSQNIDF